MFKEYLSGPRVYACATCRAHAADPDDIISKVASCSKLVLQHLEHPSHVLA